ncbi:murein L,D-transpeptidase catalytic domain family protein [Pontibacter sp. SGAir0037]|uniref:murein L,D-transpeptidase catalytic domain family protein n=1 Tax=Pontibacter sp. SGAir0037 TaxID=2571030 RepID=UPI0010CD2198|nr:murein L,D-transpeptidase catalytic domain family protein [Pontibacter sp. SGAir0037]QCR22800.1 hypothetical protein C1N53_10905 [Pontibacter sp. SGAir0037]
MKRIRWKARTKKVAKGFIPLFAPLIISPVASPLGVSATSKDIKRYKANISDYKVMQFGELTHELYNEMHLQEEGLRYEVFNNALAGYYNLKHEGRLSEKPVITIVDFTKSSREKRLWVVDIENKEILHHTYVAHGRNSGEEFAETFSNDNNSYMSSVGFYVTQDIYYGKHGLSLKLEGLDEAYNSNALDRCIVMHGAEYANEEFIEQYGRLGRSLGCPALPMEEHQGIINSVKGKTAMYVHAADNAYTSQYLDYANAMAELVHEKHLDAPLRTVDFDQEQDSTDTNTPDDAIAGTGD